MRTDILNLIEACSRLIVLSPVFWGQYLLHQALIMAKNKSMEGVWCLLKVLGSFD
jgi:hypothetical protein